MRLRVGVLLMAGFLFATGVLYALAADDGDRAGEPVADPTLLPAAQAPVDLEPASPGPAAQPTPAATLADRLASLVADDSLRARTFGVSVTAADGTSVFAHSAGVRLLPASSQKLVVAAAALTTLGPDFRYDTELRATSAPAADGVLHGDLVLVGSGDPALGTPQYGRLMPERPRTPLESLADQVVASGVRRVTGSVLGDARVFPHQPLATGWLSRYVESGNTSRSSGLTAEGGRHLFVEGNRMRSEPSVDPAATAAASLHGLLRERGVTIDGGAGTVPVLPQTTARLASVTSPPLLDLLRYSVQRSDNHLADAVFRTLGLAAGDATWTGSAAAAAQALSLLDLDLTGTSMADGSGLSRSNRLSPGFLTALDGAMTRSQLARQWKAVMAVAGESGTLRRRLTGTVAEGRLHGKTGSLEDVSSLSGVVTGPAGTRYHFAVVGNNLDRAGKEALRRLQDLVVLVLAEDLYGCEWVLPPGSAQEPELACAA